MANPVRAMVSVMVLSSAESVAAAEALARQEPTALLAVDDHDAPIVMSMPRRKPFEAVLEVTGAPTISGPPDPAASLAGDAGLRRELHDPGAVPMSRSHHAGEDLAQVVRAPRAAQDICDKHAGTASLNHLISALR